MKIRLLIIFTISLISLLAVTSKMLISNKEFTAKGTVAHADSPDVTVYSDQLENGFSNWSWNSNVSFDNADHPNSGSHDIAFTPNGYGALYLHTENAIQAASYDSLQFSIRASADNQKFAVMLYDDANQQIQNPIPLQNFGGDVTKDSYKQYTIPLTSLDPSAKPIKGIALQETTGQTQPTLFLDDVLFKAKHTPVTPTATIAPTNTPTPTITQPTNTSITSSPIFTDSLSSDFENWSWGSSVNVADASYYYSGTKSLSFSITNAWGALFLHRKTTLDTTGYTTLSFNLRATQSGQKYTLVLRDENNNSIGSPLPLSSIGGDPIASLWKSYSVSLSTLNAANKKISGVILQDASGHTQPKLYIDNLTFNGNTTSSATTSTTPTTLSAVTTTTTKANDPFANTSLYVEPDSNAKQTADSWRAAGRSSDADQMMKIANHATAIWAASSNPFSMVSDYAKKAGASGSMGVVVAYDIPGRDCGQYSSGGADYNGYKSWIDQLSGAIGSSKMAVILEPDALGLDCLQNDNTYSLLRYAIETLSSKPNISVYAEASSWVPADTMSQRLQKIGIDKAQGFSINVSGYNTTSSMITYGNAISAKIGGKHFVIDTSRNGNGPYDPSQPEPWCNPPDRALGNYPTSATGNDTVDAYLWIKIPGESDGTCRGGPSAGSWWADYALGLAQRSSQ